MKYYPAILTGNIEVVQEQLDMAMRFHDCDTVQIDLIDGMFADSLTVTPADLATCEFGTLQCDLHIMAVDPEDVVNEAIDFAALLPIRAIIGQVEKMGNEDSFIDTIRRQGWQAGLSLDVDTAIESIDEAVWRELQIVQVMGVVAGFQGQSFIERTTNLLDAVVALRAAQNLQFEIIADGGFRPDLIGKMTKHQADSYVVGSYLWKSTEPVGQWQTIQ